MSDINRSSTAVPSTAPSASTGLSQALPAPATTTAPRLHSRILVVDDDRVTVDLLSSFLRRSGYEVSAALDPMQGLNAAHRLLPALIVLDLNMPAGGGAVMLERLRRSTRTAGIPVLIVTATFQPDRVDALLGMGARQVLVKPVDPAIFLRTVNQLLQDPCSV